jgi:hypothetical protein
MTKEMKMGLHPVDQSRQLRFQICSFVFVNDIFYGHAVEKRHGALQFGRCCLFVGRGPDFFDQRFHLRSFLGVSCPSSQVLPISFYG